MADSGLAQVAGPGAGFSYSSTASARPTKTSHIEQVLHLSRFSVLHRQWPTAESLAPWVCCSQPRASRPALELAPPWVKVSLAHSGSSSSKQALSEARRDMRQPTSSVQLSILQVLGRVKEDKARQVVSRLWSPDVSHERQPEYTLKVKCAGCSLPVGRSSARSFLSGSTTGSGSTTRSAAI